MVDVAQKKVKVKLTPYCKSQFNRLIFSDGWNLEKLTRKRVADCIWRQNHIDLPIENTVHEEIVKHNRWYEIAGTIFAILVVLWAIVSLFIIF